MPRRLLAFEHPNVVLIATTPAYGFSRAESSAIVFKFIPNGDGSLAVRPASPSLKDEDVAVPPETRNACRPGNLATVRCSLDIRFEWLAVLNQCETNVDVGLTVLNDQTAALNASHRRTKPACLSVQNAVTREVRSGLLSERSGGCK
jgi:hypothetical protein